MIGDGTFSSVLYVSNLGVNRVSALRDPTTTAFAHCRLARQQRSFEISRSFH